MTATPERTLTGLDGRIFTGCFLPEWDEEPWDEETEAARNAASRAIYERYMNALRHAFPDVTLDFEEIDATPMMDTLTASYSDGTWEFVPNETRVSGIIWGIEAALMTIYGEEERGEDGEGETTGQ